MATRKFAGDRRKLLTSLVGVSAAMTLGMLPRHGLAQQTGAALKIGMIGAGREGSALGTLLIKAGHPVKFSSRHPESLKPFVDGLGPLASAGTVAEAVEFGDIVMLVVPYGAIEQIGKEFGSVIAKKALVIDVSNPIARRDGEELVNGVNAQGGPGLVTAKLLPGARIVRAFNAIGSGRLAENANRPGERIAVPMAGDDVGAIEIASKLVREIGFEPVVIGGLAMGKHLVPGTPFGGEHTASEIRSAVAALR